MKNILSFLLIAVLSISAIGQTNIPQLVSFSAVVRDANNQPLVNTAVSIRLTFKEGGQTGPLVYCALHQTTTNQNGFMSLQLNRDVLGTGCNGAPSPTFDNIPWENGGFWMEVEYQVIPGDPFVNLGQLELASSFYAFAAGTAERISGMELTGADDGDVLTYNLTTGQWEPMPASGGGGTPFDGDYNSLTNTPNIADSINLYADGSETNIIAGANVTVTGSGTTADPYIVTAASGSGGGFPPTVSTDNIDSIAWALYNTNSLSAYISHTVSSDGGETILARGICYSNSPGPNTSSSNVAPMGAGALVGQVQGQQLNVEPNSTYYVKAYAANASGTSYGNELSFTTPTITLPTAVTFAISNLTYNSVNLKGMVTDFGGQPIDSNSYSPAGFYIGTSPNPTINDMVVNTSFSSSTDTMYYYVNQWNNLGLVQGTTYYVRAYATNSVGTGYGNEISFTVPTLTLATLVTNAVTNLSWQCATLNGEITDNGGDGAMSQYSDYGVCYSTNPTPTTSDNVANGNINNNGLTYPLFSFSTCSVWGPPTFLDYNTTYYARAYATNAAGIAYGNEITFTTPVLTLPVVQTNLVYDIGSHYATFEGEVTDDGGEPSLQRGFAISESTNPTNNDFSGSGSGQYTNTSYQLQPNTTYYVRACAESAAGLVYGNEITFTTLPVGQTGEAGGTIVYDKGAFTNGWRYIEFSTTEVSASAEW